MEKEIKILLSEKQHSKLKEKVSEGGFESLEDYIGFIIKQLCGDEIDGPIFSAEEEKKQKQRLKDLGYV